MNYFLIFLILMLTFSCSTSTKKQDEKYTANSDTFDNGLSEAEIVSEADKKIISYTDTLFLGDTLKIKFKIPHPRDLAIRNPENKFFFLVYEGSDSLMPPLVDWEKFEHVGHLEIITNKTKAKPWDARINENQIIFTKSGKYEILLSDNLETDDGTPVEYQTVYYFNRHRLN